MDNQIAFTDIEAIVAQMYAGQRCALKPYFYAVDFVAFTSGSSQTGTLKLNANTDFLLTELRWGTTQVAEDTNEATIQIVDSGSNERFFDNPVLLGGICTTGNKPRALAVPRRISGNATLTIAITNGVGSDTMPAGQLVFCGVNVYVYSQNGAGG
jgi:hypothetical protein